MIFVLTLKFRIQRGELPTCQGDLVKRELTDISYVFPEAGLTIKSFYIVSSFGLLYLKHPFSFLSPHPIVLCLYLELQCYASCVSSSQSCRCSLCCTLACAQRHSISVLINLCPGPKIHTSQFTRAMITLPFTSFLFLHVFMEFLPQPHLTDHTSNGQTSQHAI